MGGAGLLTIGEFARRSGLSVRALRLYDRIGLLRPAEVVAATGYRRYTGGQLYAGRLIALLRRLDMPLSEITEIVGAAAPEAAELLAGYWTGVERRLAAQRELADRLVRSLAAETPAPAPGGTWPVSVRDVPEQHIVTELRYVTAAELRWIREATDRLTELAARSGGATGPRFVVFHGDVTEDAPGPVEVCVPVRPEASVRTEPAHREAYVPVRRGHFEPPQILSVYDAAHRWVREHGHTVTAAAREVYGYGADLDATGPEDVICDVAVPFR
ncbi:MerR family transcriptional regulator [Pseudosporangium ferrugineum]|uniref:DNA-binding transcriptional MerR regulator n=1 Tax=Pseudosporangium ferrugineum TaxID=439699 RepID=A0A2T0RI97_9ACTN|nr:MerR family transcriptional regulator [Pseudosporangium ferrugineum]PRY20820.1 DNA-binding transcriptional MerR regulator [Pseudosporangium ferrugineum]